MPPVTEKAKKNRPNKLEPKPIPSEKSKDDSSLSPQPKVKQAPPKKLEKFRLLRGRHIEKVNGENRAHQVTRDTDGRPIQPIIETDKDLCALFNVKNKAPKFERVEGATIELIDPFQRLPGETVQAYMGRLSELQDKVQTEFNQSLERVNSMEKEDIEQFAEDEGIDLTSAETLQEKKKLVKDYLSQFVGR